MYCKKCGKELPEGSQFCQFCGEKTDAAATAEKTGDKAKQGSSGGKAVYLIGAAIGLVIVIAVILIKMAGKTSPDGEGMAKEMAKEAETVQTEEAPEADKAEEDSLMEKAEQEETEEEALEAETEEEAEEPTPEKEKPLAAYVKSVSLSDADVYDEYQFDEDGDWVSAVYHGEMSVTYQYLTDDAGNKVNADRKQAVLLVDATTISIGHSLCGIEYSKHLLQTMDTGVRHESEENKQYDYDEHIELVYDGQNRLIEVDGTNKCGTYTYNDNVIYAYQEKDGETIVTATGRSDIRGTQENPESSTLVFDSEDRLVRHEINTGYYVARDEYIYDADGNVVKWVDYDYTPERDGNSASESESIHEYTYDAQGNKVKEKETYNRNGSINEYITECEYNDDGNMVKYKSGSASGIWEYDGEGRLTASTVYRNNGFDDDGVYEELEEYLYDEQGRLLTYCRSDTNNSQTEENTMEYRYDGQGRLSEALLNGKVIVAAVYNSDGALGKLSYAVAPSSNPRAEITDKYLEKGLIFDLLPENLKYEDYCRTPSILYLNYRNNGTTRTISDFDYNETTIEYR